MTDVLRYSKKAFTWSVVAMTILWSVGAAALAPMVVHAEDTSCPELSVGDLFKVPNNSSVYLLNANMERMYFPNGEVYKTWYSDFSEVEEIPSLCVDNYPAPSSAPFGVNYRPGSRLVKVVISPSVYVVEPGNQISKLGSEAVAKALYGDNWASLVRDVPDVYWPNYAHRGDEVTEAVPHDGMLLMAEGGDTVYYVENGELHEVEASEASAALAAASLGGVGAGDVRVVSQDVLDALSMASGTVTEGSLYADPAQGVGGSGSNGDSGSDNEGNVPSGSLSVRLSANTPAASNVAQGANMNVLALNFEAGNEAVKIQKLTLTQVGLSDSSDVENVKIVDANGLVYGNTVTALNSNDTAVVTFSNPLEIGANSTETYYVRFGVPSSGSTTGNSVQFALQSADHVDTMNASVSGSFPITGNAFGIIGTTIGTATVAQDGTTVDSTPDAGDENVVLNKFKVTAGATEAIVIKSLTFKEAGTASISDYANVELYDVTNGASLGETSYNAEGKAHFTGLNITVDKGKSHRFQVRTDVLSGAGLTMNADLIDGSDVMMSVTGDKFGFYLTPAISNSWSGKGSNDQTINSGSLVVTKSAETPAAGSIAAGDDRVLAAFTLEAKGEPILVTALTVSTTLGTMLTSEVTNMVLKDANGEIVAGPLNGTQGTGQAESAAFSDSFTVPLGQHDYYFEATISDNVSSNDTLLSAIYAAGSITAKGFNTGDSVTATGSFPAQGNTQTVNAATLSAVTLTSPAARSVAPGVSDLIWMTGALRASNSGEAVLVETIVVEATLGDAGDDANDLDNMEIWADLNDENSDRGDVYETRVSATEQFTDSAAGDETLSFTLTSPIRVEKNGEVVVAVVGDLASGATAGDTFTMSFDTDAGDVTGSGADTGATANATPTGAGQTFTVAASGTLTLSTESTYPSTTPQLAYSQQAGLVLAEFRLAANNVENLDLDSLKLTDLGSDNAVQKYWFYVGDTAIGNVSGGATAEIFLADNTMLVPSNGHIVVTVKGTMADVDGSTVSQGNTVKPVLDAAGDVDTTGKASGSAVDSTQTDIYGPTTTIYGAYPVFSIPSGWDNEATPGAVGGNIVVARYHVTNPGDEDLTFENADGNSLKVYFSSSVNGSSANKNFTLKNATTGQSLDTVAQASSSTSATFDFTDNSLTVAPGATVVLEVLVDTAIFDASGESIQAYLDDGTATDVDWGVAGSGSYNHGDIIFRGDLYSRSFQRS